MKNIKRTPDAQPLNDWALLLILVYSPGNRIPTIACLCESYEVDDDGVLSMFCDDATTIVEDYSWYQVFDGTNEEFTKLSTDIENFVNNLQEQSDDTTVDR